MKVQSSFIITPGSITLVYGGKPYSMSSNNDSYKVVFGLLKKGKEAEAVSYFDIPNAVKSYIKKGIEIKNGTILYNGEELHGLVVERILGFMRDGLNSKPLIKFLEKLLKNTQPVVRERLFGFLENKHIPITQDGNFIGYKSVTGDYLDWHTRKISNRVGVINKLKDSEINRNPDQVCASGSYHVGNYKYAEAFNKCAEQRIVLCEVDPADVLCVPDYDHDKIRVCKYKVIDEMTDKQVPLANKKYTVQKDGMGLVNYHNKRDKFGRFIKRK